MKAIPEEVKSSGALNIVKIEGAMTLNLKEGGEGEMSLKIDVRAAFDEKRTEPLPRMRVDAVEEEDVEDGEDDDEEDEEDEDEDHAAKFGEKKAKSFNKPKQRKSGMGKGTGKSYGKPKTMGASVKKVEEVKEEEKKVEPVVEVKFGGGVGVGTPKEVEDLPGEEEATTVVDKLLGLTGKIASWFS